MAGLLKAVKSVVTGSEEAPYEVKSKTDTFEEREYPALKWVCARKKAKARADVQRDMFFMLFAYISGTNERDEKIDMTAPVTVEEIIQLKEDGEEEEEKEYVMGFYIPSILQEDPPKPTGVDVFIQQRDAMTVLTRTFGGYAKDAEWKNEREALLEEVKKAGFTVDAKYYTAGYDPPFKPLFRRNEVWLIKKD